MRQGADELESLAGKTGNLIMHDPHVCELIDQHLQVDVQYFRFGGSAVAGVLSGIRSELADRLTEINDAELPAAVAPPAQHDEIVMLRPNLYGLGVDLRALWRRLWGPRQPG